MADFTIEANVVPKIDNREKRKVQEQLDEMGAGMSLSLDSGNGGRGRRSGADVGDVVDELQQVNRSFDTLLTRITQIAGVRAGTSSEALASVGDAIGNQVDRLPDAISSPLKGFGGEIQSIIAGGIGLEGGLASELSKQVGAKGESVGQLEIARPITDSIDALKADITQGGGIAIRGDQFETVRDGFGDVASIKNAIVAQRTVEVSSKFFDGTKEETREFAQVSLADEEFNTINEGVEVLKDIRFAISAQRIEMIRRLPLGDDDGPDGENVFTLEKNQFGELTDELEAQTTLLRTIAVQSLRGGSGGAGGILGGAGLARGAGSAGLLGGALLASGAITAGIRGALGQGVFGEEGKETLEGRTRFEGISGFEEALKNPLDAFVNGVKNALDPTGLIETGIKSAVPDTFASEVTRKFNEGIDKAQNNPNLLDQAGIDIPGLGLSEAEKRKQFPEFLDLPIEEFNVSAQEQAQARQRLNRDTTTTGRSDVTQQANITYEPPTRQEIVAEVEPNVEVNTQDLQREVEQTVSDEVQRQVNQAFRDFSVDI